MRSDGEGERSASGGPPDLRVRLAVFAALAAVVVGGAVDLWMDAPTTLRSPHVLFEGALVLYSLGLSAYLLRRWRRASRSLRRTEERLEAREAERDAWRRRARSLLRGLGEEIDRQFEAWELTPSEKEVALLLIKGYSHKRIADMTGRAERTARQHAGSVYDKAGLSGRAELAAFFLEDLMLPREGENSG